jgi:hypothetical protein
MTLSWLGVTGGVLGREHRRRGRGSQDAAAVSFDLGVACAVVCDGCSSGEASEVGARLSARWLAAHAPRLRAEHEDVGALATALLDGLVAHLGRVADDLAGLGDRAPVVAQLLLATALVALIDTRPGGRAVVLGVGDGLFVIDDRVRAVGDGGSAPAYPAYRLLDDATCPPRDARAVTMDILHEGPADAVTTLALATDGALELEQTRGERLRDGSKVEGLAELARDERLARNPSLLGKRLLALGEAHGRLWDDTTIALLARAPEGS